MITSLCSSSSNDLSKLEIIRTAFSHVVFKNWFLTCSHSEIPNRHVQNEANFCELLTVLSCKYLTQTCSLANSQEEIASFVRPFKSKLISLMKLVFTSQNERLASLWENMKLGIASCLSALTYSEAADLLNSILCLSVCELAVVEGMFEVLQVLLGKFIERSEKTSVRCLKAKTVKAMFELAFCDSKQNNFELCLLELLEEFPVFCAVVPVAVLENCMEAGNLKLVRVLSAHNPSHLQKLRTYLQEHQISWDAYPKLQCLLLLNLFLGSEVPNVTKAEKSFVRKLSKEFWKLLGAVIVDGVATDEESDLNVTNTLNGILQKGLIKESSLSSLLNQITQQSLSCQNVASLHSLSLLTQVFDSFSTSLPDFKVDGDSSKLCWMKILLHWLQLILKNPDSANFLLLEFCFETIGALQQTDGSDVLKALQSTDSWLHIATSVLRKGLRCCVTGPCLMTLLKELCTVIYADTAGAVSPTVSELYRLVVNHSAFTSIMVEEDLAVLKEPVVDLMSALVKLNGSCCSPEHFPFLLAAYRATLAPTDQKLLYLMSLYEENGSSMHGFRPFKWGPTAVAYYASQANTRLALWKQPRIEDIVQLLDKEKLVHTALNFPLDLELKPKDNPVLSFNVYEGATHALYDPRFLLLVFNHFLQPGSVVDCEKFITSQCLSLLFSSLSCNDEGLRSLGYNTLGLFYQHLEGVWKTYSKIWIFMLDALRNALTKPNLRLPCLITTFLVKSTDVLSKPSDSSFSVVYKFLALKPALDIANVPEFYTLFYSSDVYHRHHRTWIITLLQEGLRNTLDFHLCQKRFVFPILLTYCASELSPVQHKVQILGILRAAVRIRSAALSLCRAQSLMTWIQSVIANHIPEKQESDMLSEIVLILDNLWHTSTTPSAPKELGFRCRKTKDNGKLELENKDESPASDEDEEADDCGSDPESMDTNEAVEVATTTESSSGRKSFQTFYPSFLNELLLICLPLLDKIRCHSDVKTISRCLKICSLCFTSFAIFKPYLPYLTDSHLEILLSCARKKSNDDSFSTTSDIADQTECCYHATKLLMLVPPKLYLGTEKAGLVFQVVIKEADSDVADLELLQLVSEWFTDCVKRSEMEHILSFLVHESNCVEVVFSWISICVTLRTTQTVQSDLTLRLLRTLVKLFLILMPVKHVILADVCKALRDCETITEEQNVLELAMLIHESWLEESVSKKIIRKYKPFTKLQ